jgi:serine phosphatase RsbU (regulator of sigma subunit)/pSer/pThr/pTyr-binding forkhead associated (FHA) protein
MIKLHVVPVQGEPFDHPLGDGPLVVGRASGSDLVLEDRFLSRHHSRIFRQGGQLMIEDLESRNGTLVNGRPVKEPSPLKPGDVIKISGSVLTVLDADQTADSGGAGRLSSVRTISDELPDHTILRSASGLLSDATTEGREIGGDAEEVRRYAERLKLLNEVHRALGRSMELDELLELILERVFDHLRPEQGAVFLKRGGELVLGATRSLPGVDGEFVTSTSLQREVTEKGMAALVLDVESDERFAAAQSILFSGIRSLVAAPLLDIEGTLGMIVLSSRAGVRQFSEEDMELLVSLASVAALCLRNVSLAAEAVEHQRLEQELTLGRRIQEALLPDRLPEVEGYELYARNIPSRGVSGDYYVVLERRRESGDGECVLMVADVSGKGIAASILTASLEALAAGPIEDGLDPDEIFRRLSRLLHHRTPPEKYATAFLAVLDPATGRLRYANAGHNAALMVRASGEVEELASTGLPLGLLEQAAYQAGEAELGGGDTLILYTDGITEAEDPDDEEYGLERLTALCREHRREGPEPIVRRLAESLESFVRGRPFADDRTIVMAQRR